MMMNESEKIQLMQTDWCINFINYYFRKQSLNKAINHFAIKTDLPLFKPLEFKYTLDQIILNGADKDRLVRSLSGIKKTCLENIGLWDNQLSKIYTKPENSSEDTLLKIEIKNSTQGIVQKQNENLTKDDSMLINDYDFAQFTNHVLKAIVDLEAISHELRSIFVSERAYQKCLDLMEHLDITLDGKSILTKGREGKLTGAIVAMTETPNFFKSKFTHKRLLSIFNGYLETDYKTFKTNGKVYDESKDLAERFLGRKPKK